MTARRFSLVLAALLACGPAAAFADEDPPTDDATPGGPMPGESAPPPEGAAPAGLAGYPMREVDRPIVLPLKLWQADADLGIDLSKGNVFKNLGLGLGASYGVIPKLDVGAHAGLQLKPGGNTFRSLDLDGQYELVGHWLVGRGDILIAHFPGKTQYGIGLGLPIKRKLTGDLAIEVLDTVLTVYFDPTVKFLTLPAALHIQAMPKLAVIVKTAIVLPDFKGNHFGLPLTFDGQYAVSPRLDVGAGLSFNNLHPAAGSAVDSRSLDLYVQVRF